ncbi:MAG: hypothetical protein ACRENB_06010 [Gemmatimonadales bacterium]
MSPTQAATRFLPLLYVAGALLLLDQFADLVATLTAGEVELSSPRWRFGAVGLVVTRASVLLLGDLFLYLAAVSLAHYRTLRVLGVLHLLVAAMLLATLVVFGLDAVQVRRLVREGGEGVFDVAAARGAMLLLAGSALAAWAGLVSWRAGSWSTVRRDSGGGSIVVGQSEGKR